MAGRHEALGDGIPGAQDPVHHPVAEVTAEVVVPLEVEELPGSSVVVN